VTTFGSVCSGIEAASVAWESLDWTPAWFAEVDPFASSVLAHRFPGVANLGDMTAIATLIRAGVVDAPDILVGGTPCQAFSVAGARAGLIDPRGQLTLAYADLANAIDEQRPDDECVIYWENVPGVLSDKTNAFGCFLAILAGESVPLESAGGKWPNAGCVYGPQRAIAWRVLDAQYFGVAQRRRRVFVVASARKGFDPAAVLFESEGVRRDTAPSREAGQNATCGTLRSTDGGSDVDHARAGHLQVAGTLLKGGHSNNPLDETLICMAHGQGGAEIATDRAPTLTCNHEAPIAAYAFQPRIARNGRGDMGKGDAAPCVALAFDCKASGPAGFGVGEIASTMRSMGHSGSHQNGGGRLAVCITGDVTHTLKAEGFDASEDGTGRGQPIVTYSSATEFLPQSSRVYSETELSPTLQATGTRNGNRAPQVHAGMAVRRLTPRECERLQGFPDDWTLVPHGRKMAADGPRYKALGNSMAVPCMRWLGMRLALKYPRYAT
jgi:DNA (cytosine-5)-methyltransferase 1